MRKSSKIALLWICAALLCVAGLHVALALEASQNNPTRRNGSAKVALLPGARFAIADFDGDWKPDLAVVETTGAREVTERYAVRLQLSAGKALWFLIDAPSGGVWLAARDVNGDDLPDLVVSSISDKRVVAVLLNRGHGMFSQGELGAYAESAREFDLFLHGPSACNVDLTAASLRNSSNGIQTGCAGSHISLSAESLKAPGLPSPSRTATFGKPTRSPPALSLA
jgi:hypothetical protein